MPSQVEEDGDEVFVSIKNVRHCGVKPRVEDGFWRCPECGVSFGISMTTGKRTTIAKENR